MWLAFDDPAAEAEFRRLDDDSAVRRRVVGALLGAVLFGLFAFFDERLTGVDADQLLVIRGIVVLGCLSGALLLAFPRLGRARVWFMYGAVLATSWGLDVFPFVSGYPPAAVTGGNMLSAVGLFTVVGIRANLVLPACALLFGGWAVAAVAHGGDLPTVLFNATLLGGVLAMGGVAAFMFEALRRQGFVREKELQVERERSDRLLHNILPDEIAAQLRRDPAAIADAADEVTVVFADVVGFTPMAAHLPPTALVRLLDELFSQFDAVCRQHGIEKIKTIGDAYMAVAGVPRDDPDHARSAARAAVGMFEVADRFQGWPGHLDLRVGLSSGPIVAGVIGRDKFAYDLWGDTVNTASRMESHGQPGRIQVSEQTRRLLDGHYEFSAPLQTTVKGKGVLTTYLLQP